MFNGSPLEDIVNSALQGSKWMAAFDSFYKSRSEGPNEMVVQAGIQKAMRMVLDLNTR